MAGHRNWVAGQAAYMRGDYETALRELRPLAEDGHPEAQHHLGMMYGYGHGVQPDKAEAVKWLRLGASAGCLPAQRSLGFMYRAGICVPEDDAEMTKWNGLAAAGGDKEALKWLLFAAEKGEPYAQYVLGEIYTGRKGVPPNYVIAHMWFDLAVSRFSDSENELKELAIASRIHIAARMTTDQVAEARRLVRIWRPK